MPQRENDFQRVVTAIQRVFAPKGAKITPSAIVRDESGTEREIDVLIEFSSGLYPIKIAVEAKDFSRPIDVLTVEQYAGKYNCRGGISVSQVVIVGRRFSKTAIKKAANLGFQLNTIESIESDKVSFFDGRPPDMPKDYKPKLILKRNWKIFARNGKPIEIENEKEWQLVEKEHKIVKNCLHCLVNRTSAPIFKKLEELRAKDRQIPLAGLVRVDVSNFFLTNKQKNLDLSKLEINFPYGFILPKMQSQTATLTTNELGTQQVVVNTGELGSGKIEISFVKPPEGKSPDKMTLNFPGIKMGKIEWDLVLSRAGALKLKSDQNLS